MELKDLLNDVQKLLDVITSSRKGSIGSINNIYLCQLDRKWCDDLSVKLQRHLTPAAPDGECQCVCPAGVGICGFGNPDTNKCNYRRPVS